MKKIKKIVFFLGVLSIFLVMGFLFSKDTDFYEQINKPSFAPKNIVFSVVWTGLYVIQAYYITHVVFHKGEIENSKKLIYLLILNAVLNILYMPVFFIFKNLFGGFIINLFIVISLILIIYKSKISHIKEWYLEIPYLAWTIYALVLSISIYLMN